MPKPQKYIKLQILCNKFNKEDASLKLIVDFIEIKQHKTIFYKGLQSNSVKNPYKNEKWGIYFYKLWNAGKSIQDVYLKDYEPKLF